MERDERGLQTPAGGGDTAAAKAYLQDLYDYVRMDSDMDPLLLFEQLCCMLVRDVGEEEYRAMTALGPDALIHWYEKMVGQHCAGELGWRVSTHEFMRRPELLQRFLTAVRGVRARVRKDPAALGPLLAEFLETLVQSRQSGTLYTPLQTAREIVKFLNQERQTTLSTEVLDPACGSGAFLAAALEHMGAENSVGRLHFLGLEREERLRTCVSQLAYFYGTRVRVEMEEGGPVLDIGRAAFDVILANPLFRAQTLRDRERFGDTGDLPIRTNDIHRAFLQRILLGLRPGGECAVIVPDSFLGASSGDAIRIRRWIVDEFQCRSVVKLPYYTFYPQATVNASVLFIRRPEPSEKGNPERERVFFSSVDVDGRSNDTRRLPVSRNDFDELRRAWGERESLWREWCEAARGRNVYDVDVPARWDYACFWFGERRNIRSRDYSLLPEQYRPAQLLSGPVRDPKELLEELGRLGREMMDLTARLTEAEYDG